MNKRVILVAFFYLSLLNGFSQVDSIPASGQIEKKDLLLTECDFDKNAEALVLFDVGEAIFKEYKVAINTEVKRHIRIKILTNKGLDRANIKLPYLLGSLGEHLSIEEAQTFNIDDNGNVLITRVDKKSIVDKAINKSIAEKVFTFPDVRVGSVIEYTYKTTGLIKNGLRDWHFQTSIPVKFSRYAVQFPPDMALVCQVNGSLPFKQQYSSVWSDTVHTYTMTEVPAFQLEPYMTCLDDYSQKLSINADAVVYSGQRTWLMPSWGILSLELMTSEEFGKQLLNNIPNTEALDDSLKGTTDPYRRMMVVYYYVKNNMHWNDRNSIGTQQGIKASWKEKRGTNGEINLILISLLKQAGLEPFPALVSTHGHGKVDLNKPSFQRFDRLMVFIKINDQEYVLDAANKFTSPKQIPWDVQYSNGLVIFSNGLASEKYLNVRSELKPLWNKKDAFKDLVQIQGNIDDDGVLTGDATVTSYEYSRSKRMVDLQQGKDQFLDKYFIAGNSAIHIDSSLLVNENVDTLPLKQKVWFSEKLNSSGSYKYFSTNLFSCLEKNPFTADKRFSDVFFGATQNYNIVENIFIPDGYGFDGVPKDVFITTPDGGVVFSRNISLQNDLISVHISIDFKKPVYQSSEYLAFREFYEKMFSLLNEQIVIKKLK
jgi:hypothetical protein